MNNHDDEETLLRVDSVSKSFRDGKESLPVLSGVSFGVGGGRLCALCGPSGAGKTTLLNIIAGFDNPDRGQVHLGRERIDSLGEERKARLRTKEIGVVFQGANLVSHLTALENVLLPTMFLESSLADQKKSLAITLLTALGLEPKMAKPPSRLSDGEKRRVSIARALVTGPRLVLADEPTINLDAENRKSVMNLLKTFASDGGTAVIATHDEDVARSSDYTLRIKDGVVSS